jgi:solute carrier family 25 (mitochondrial carnitine/acylcarnitine transporter), member 20/29
MTRSLTQNFGYTALWRGSSPMIGAVPIQNALLMGGYGLGLQYANKSNSNSNNKYMAIFVGGCSGGVLQSFLMSPVELVKVSQQCIMMMPRSPQTSPLRNVNSSVPVVAWNLLTTTAHGGIPSPSRAAWTTGLGATLLRDGIPHGVWFVSYEWCKVEMQKTAAWQQDSVMVPLLSGAVAATTAWAVGYPADLIKTRIQSRATVTNTSNSSSRNVNLGILATARELIHESNGRIVSGLYRGFLLKLVRSVPASMIGFTTYEFVKKQVLLEPTVLG